MELTSKERQELEYASAINMRWIARDDDKAVFSHTEKPNKDNGDWHSPLAFYLTLGEYEWLNTETCVSIEEILKGCEESGEENEL